MKKIGDILTDVERNSNLPLSNAPIKQNVKGIKNMDKLIDKYLNIHKEIQEAVNNKDKLTFVPRFMCFSALPASDTGEKTYQNVMQFGDIVVTVKIFSPYGIPYGMWARRLLAFICHEALRNQDPVVLLGKTQSEFLKKIHPKELFASGGKRGIIKAIKEQSKRLFSASLFIECHDKGEWAFKNSVFIEKGNIQWTENYKAPWEGSVTLSDAMFQEVKANAVPIEIATLNQFSSTLAFDVYLWLRWKTHHLRKDTYVTWDQLFKQFGMGYQQNNRGRLDFKRKIKKHIQNTQFLFAGKWSFLFEKSALRIVSTKKKSASFSL